MSISISAIIPCYNSEKFIREAVMSVIGQSLPVNEIIVVDNNCTDDTIAVVQELGGVKVVRQPKQGLAAARNQGIRAARGDWLAFLDSDDIWLKDKIFHQCSLIEKFPGTRLVASDYHFLDTIHPAGHRLMRSFSFPKPASTDRVVLGDIYHYAEVTSPDLLNWFRINGSTGMVHRQVFEEVGMFNEDLPYREEVEFFMRALSRHPIGTISIPLALIRLHGSNLGQNQKALYDWHRRVIEMMRAAPGNYARGAVEHNLDFIKRMFVMQAEAVSNGLRRDPERAPRDILGKPIGNFIPVDCNARMHRFDPG